MAATSITLDELLAEFDRLGISRPASDDGKTRDELAKDWGVGRNKVSELLRSAQTAGALKVGKRQRERIDGTASWIPVYQIVVDKPKGKKR